MLIYRITAIGAFLIFIMIIIILKKKKLMTKELLTFNMDELITEDDNSELSTLTKVYATDGITALYINKYLISLDRKNLSKVLICNYISKAPTIAFLVVMFDSQHQLIGIKKIFENKISNYSFSIKLKRKCEYVKIVMICEEKVKIDKLLFNKIPAKNYKLFIFLSTGLVLTGLYALRQLLSEIFIGFYINEFYDQYNYYFLGVIGLISVIYYIVSLCVLHKNMRGVKTYE